MTGGRSKWLTSVPSKSVESRRIMRAKGTRLKVEPCIATGKSFPMKSAYELAMERLEKQSPTAKLTDAQKTELAEIDSTFKARIAERELLLRGEIEKALSAGQLDEMEKI